jgi:hypothetical protein
VNEDGFKYWAFISYSHADAKWGDWLHAALETYRVPSRLVRKAQPEGSVPKRIFPVFRDREELAGFVAAALGANFRGLPMGEVTDWNLVTLDGEQQQAWR